MQSYQNLNLKKEKITVTEKTNTGDSVIIIITKTPETVVQGVHKQQATLYVKRENIL